MKELQELFSYISQEHNVQLLENELLEVVEIVKRYLTTDSDEGAEVTLDCGVIKPCMDCNRNGVLTVGTSDGLNALLKIKEALQDTWEFENYECDNGPTLGSCTVKTCLHCRVKRILDETGI